MATAVASRLRKLAEVFDTSDREATQAWLLAYFAGPEYEGHREALVRALVTGRRTYTFERYDAAGEVIAYYMVWWNRGGRDALAFSAPGAIVRALRGEPPVVRAILLHEPESGPTTPREPAPPEPMPPAAPEAATHGAATAR